MVWIFEKLIKEYGDPFAANVLKVTSSPQRSYNETISPRHLIKWDSTKFYTVSIKNASFEFEFTRSKCVFTRYRFKGINTACSPYKWVVEGSIDHVNYITLDKIDRSLCNTTLFSSECYEEFPIKRKARVKYIKVVNTGGECKGSHLYFGLTSVDFYGNEYFSQKKPMNIKIFVYILNSIFIY